METFIESYCTIQNNSIVRDGESVFRADANGFYDFSKKAYQYLEINYPKFYKMDNLSKLAFLASELVLKNEIDIAVENNIGLVLSNKSSSLDTDVKFQNSISDRDNYFPSPAVFVYTLPNICIGEISIRHQLKSENYFFIFEAFNPVFMRNFAGELIASKKADKVLCGWVELMDEDYKAFLYLVSPEGHIKHDKESIAKLYNR
jgi:hypothetical protein